MTKNCPSWFSQFSKSSTFEWIGFLGYVSRGHSGYHCNPGDQRTSYQLLLAQTAFFIQKEFRTQTIPPEIIAVGAAS